MITIILLSGVRQKVTALTLKVSGKDKENLKTVETEALLNELLDLAEQLGLEIRRVFLDGRGGGLCRLGDKWVLFVDQSGDMAEQLAQTAGALARRDDLENLYIRPQVREIIEQFRENGG